MPKPPAILIKLSEIEKLINGLVTAGLIAVDVTKGGKLQITPCDPYLWEEEAEEE